MKKNQFREVPRFNNIKEIIYNSVKLYPNNIAFTTKITENSNIKYIDYSYKKLLEDINAFGTSLYKLGLKDKRIAIIGKNSYKWAVAHLSNQLGNMVSVPLDKELQIEELEECLIRSKVEAIVFDSKLSDSIDKVKETSNTSIKYYICMEEIEGYLSFDKLLVEGKKHLENDYLEYIDCKIDAKKMSILLFTSGTTEKSKAVMLNQYGIATNVYDMQIVETFYDTDVNIAFLPYHHIFGSTGMIVMLSSGMKNVFADGLRYIKQNLKEYKVSVFVGVPAIIDKMYVSIEKELKKQRKSKLINIAKKISNILLKVKIDLRKTIFKKLINELGGNMRFIISGGAPLDKKVAKWFNEIGIHLVQGYGLTETSPVISAENDYCIKYGSVGIPMKNVEIEIANKDENGIGEIKVKSPTVMLGYYNDEEKTKEALKNDWFYTGDLGYIDKDGFLFITGRIKDMIVLKNGKKVFPEELEIMVNKLEEVEEAFVFAVPDETDKNDVKVAVQVVYNENEVKKKYGNINHLKEVIWNKIKEINKSLPKYKYIKKIFLTTEPLIKTTTNKIKRSEELRKILFQKKNSI